jgi:di/tricarboxylate transporter
MTLLPSAHAAASILLAMLMFYGFATGKAKVEIISLMTIGMIALGLYFFPLAGTDPNDGLKLAFEGFGHYALITICALMVMGRGLVVTGALDPAARALTKVWRVNKQLGLFVTLIMAMALSMMINDTPVLVLLLPIMVQLAANGGMPASKTLMPINAALLIGGMATTIGTSTNLLVMSIATDLGMPPMSVFHFTPLVLCAALVAFPYVWIVMPRLLPDNSREAGHAPRRFLATLNISADSPLVKKSPAELKSQLPEDIEFENGPLSPIEPNSRIGISGTHESLEQAMRLLSAAAAPRWLVEAVRADANRTGADINYVEMAIASDSRLIGLTLQSSGLKNVAVIGVDQARRLQYETRARSAEAPLAEGDVLLVMGTEINLQDFAAEAGLLMLEGAKEMPRSAKALLSLIIMGGSVALASFGLLPIAISALGGAVLMFITGCVKFDRVGRALSAKVIVLVAASIAIGKLILVSGAADWLGQLLALGLQYLPAAGVLAAIMLFVTVLTNFASNATAAAVGTPIAYSLATKLGIPMEPMVLAVLFGCNLCYATPVAYQTNMLIMAEGDYQFKDYIRTGVPLVALMIVTLSTLLVWFYDL